MGFQLQRKVVFMFGAVVLSALMGVACNRTSPAKSDGVLMNATSATQVTPVTSAAQSPTPASRTQTPTQQPPTASSSPQLLPTSAQKPVVAPSSSPVVCKMDEPEIYQLVFRKTRYPIAGLGTLMALGYTGDQLASCSSMSQYSEGVSITRLLKGSSDPVYFMENGFRRHIPDMETFHFLDHWLYFEKEGISVVPDEILTLWPLGDPLPSAPQPYQEVVIDVYTIRLYHPLPGYGMYDMATVTSPTQPEIRIGSVQALGVLPVPDVTGEGEPDVMFETYAGGSHCCSGTVVYNLGPVPTTVLDIRSTDIYYDGRGTFQDIDGNGTYEFITRDPIAGISCSQPSVKVILQYEPGRGYIGASPRFAAVYAEDIAKDTQLAESSIEESKTGYKCGVAEVIMDYLYSGQVSRAHDELLRLYLGADVEEFWQQLQQIASQGRFYVPPAQ